MNRIGGKKTVLRLSLGFVTWLSVAPPAAAIWPFDKKGLDYDIAIEGAGSNARERVLREKALTQVEKDNPPQAAGEVESLGATISERFRRVMVADGFYDARVDYRFEAAAKPVLHYSVASGERYSLSGWRAVWTGSPLPLPKDTPVETGKAATAERVQAGGFALAKVLAAKSCLLSLNVASKVEIDPATHEAVAIYTVTHGEKANFGPTDIRGNGRVTPKTVRKMVKWTQGECFDPQKLEETRGDLIKSQLFATAETKVAARPGRDGEAPVTLTLKERARHTVSFGASYATDTGYGITGHWEDRNLRGHAEKLAADATISELEYSIGPTYTIPYFLRDDQKLSLTANAARQNTDAYDATNLTAAATIERKLFDHVNGGIGLGARATDVEQAGEKDTFGLVFAPAFLEWDDRNDTLDPKRGILSRLSVAPYTDVTGKGVSFVKTTLSGQTYLTAAEWPLEPTLAVRGVIGEISGADTSDVPPDLRFYAGGGGSVRGYAYQALGPRLSTDPEQPLGGTGWTELSTELRLRFNEDFGGVAFVDGGNVYDADLPDPSRKLFFGTGVGVRYFSPIGPLRFDVAVPLDKREGDSAWQLYVSIGQAF